MLEIDHIFICSAVGAPEAGSLIELGLDEGAPNRHPGQGTANRRFFFSNFMLEFLWVENPEEARSPQTARMKLWERWSQRESGASPFGIILRGDECPFRSWTYQPVTMPGLSLEIAEDTAIEEPMWCYVKPYSRRAGMAGTLARARLSCPTSRVAQAMAERGVIDLITGPHALTLEFDSALILRFPLAYRGERGYDS